MIHVCAPDMPVQEWASAAKRRRARRSYDGVKIDQSTLDELERHCETFMPAATARTVLIRNAPESIFVGIAGSYGRISGVSAALVMLARDGEEHSKELAGYTGQAAILEATRLGLDTCWVGGMFRTGRVAKSTSMHAGEKVFAISPVGHASENLSGAERLVYRMKVTPKPRKPLEEIASGWRSWPAWTHSMVEAARIAPSAMNRQPWRFRMQDGALVISFDGTDMPKTSKRLDCGIAMLDAEVGARSAGVGGQWELLDRGSDVARFVVSEET